MDVFIKSFNRMFCLARCLATVEKYVVGASHIVVLDDGTPRVFLDVVQKRYPNVEIIQPPHGERKTELVANGIYNERFSPEEYEKWGLMNPSAFWREEIGKSQSEYVCVLEEDVWFVRPLDLNAVKRRLSAHNTLIFHLWLRAITAAARPTLTSVRAAIDDGLTAIYFEPHIKMNVDRSQVFVPAQAIYKRDYFTKAFSATDYRFTVKSQFNLAVEYINALTTTPTFAYAEHDLVVHGFTTTSRKTELTGEAFDPFPMNRALNQAMHDDRFDYCADLPRDFSEARIFETIEQYVSRDKAVEWQAWYKKFQDYYRSLGDVIG